MHERSFLLDLIEQDGHRVEREGKTLKILCPFHSEKTASCAILDSDHEPLHHLHCFGCGWHGDAIKYLVEFRKMEMKDALRLREQAGGRPGASSTSSGPGKKARNDGGRKTSAKAKPKKGKFRKELPTNFAMRHDYYGADGKLKFVILRYEKEDGTKIPVPYHRVKMGDEIGWFNTMPPHLEDCRPMYRLRELMASEAGRQVMIVEGEKCADWVARAAAKAVVTTWSGGTAVWKKTDWTQLHGRSLLLVSDADSPGRKAMTELAAHLYPHCPNIAIALPEGETGDDIADEIEHGNVKAWLDALIQPYEPPEPEPEDEGPPGPDPPPAESAPEGPGKPQRPPPQEPDSDIGENPYFTVLGNVDQAVIVKLRTNQLVSVSRAGLTSPQQLISLAPDVGWWTLMLRSDGLSRPAAMLAGAALIKVADAKGQIDLSRVYNRGALRNDAGETVWHLGNKLIVDGAESGLDHTDGNIYVSGPKIDVGDLKKGLAPEQRALMSDTILRYRWLAEEDGKRMLGWMVSAMVGGLLEWRPHIWFLGPSEQGKSWFIKEVMLRLHWTATTRFAAPTEATIARRIGSSPLPIILEEAEPERSWLNSVVELCRIAAGGEGERTRAEGSHGIISTLPQFSCCMCSTRLPRLQAADNNRFVLIRLSATGVEDWPTLKNDLQKLFRPPSRLPTAFRASMVREAREIAAHADSIAAELTSEGVGARQAAIRAALSAGYQWWTGETEILEIASPRSRNKQADAVELLLGILGHRVRTPGGRDQTLLDMAVSYEHEDTAATYGIRVESEGLLLATHHPSLEKTLSRSRFAGADIRALLMQMDGVTQTRNPRRFGAYRDRALVFSVDACAALGLDLAKGSTPTQDSQGGMF